MGTKSELQADIKEAFDSTDDLNDGIVGFTLLIYNKGNYDPVTHEVIDPHPETKLGLRGIFLNPSEEEILESNLEPEDVYVLMLSNETKGIKPKISDIIRRDDNLEEFRIMSMKSDPFNAMFTAEARRFT